MTISRAGSIGLNDGIHGFLLAWRWRSPVLNEWQPIALVFSEYDRDVLLSSWIGSSCHDGQCFEHAAFEVGPSDA